MPLNQVKAVNEFLPAHPEQKVSPVQFAEQIFGTYTARCLPKDSIGLANLFNGTFFKL
jgi:hypothetical protein